MRLVAHPLVFFVEEIFRYDENVVMRLGIGSWPCRSNSDGGNAEICYR
jgi:hypothetical protein